MSVSASEQEYLLTRAAVLTPLLSDLERVSHLTLNLLTESLTNSVVLVRSIYNTGTKSWSDIAVVAIKAKLKFLSRTRELLYLGATLLCLL